MKEILDKLYNHERLSKSEAKQVLQDIAAEKFNEAHLASFMTVFMMRPISVEELAGFRDALKELAIQLDFSDFNTIDIVGTGGDGKNTFNISTLTSFVVAGTGQKVAKHGNYSLSSQSGSSDMLESFGYQFTNDEHILKHQLEKANICFLHAPKFHPAMKAVGPTRKALALKTFFNILGPLVNPSSPKSHFLGTYNLEVARLYHYILQEENSNYGIIHALDGYDEISLTSAFKIFTKTGEKLISPEDLGMKRIQQSAIFGGNSVSEAATIFKTILDGNGTDSQNNVVLTNAAFALQIVDETKTFETAFEEAKNSLLELKAKKVFRDNYKLGNIHMTILDKIIAFKKKEAAKIRAEIPLKKLLESPNFNREVFSLEKSLLDFNSTGIIAEFKRQSPSKGIINHKVSIAEVTQGYLDANVAAQSILTDISFFGGTILDLMEARVINQEKPILRKDFVVDGFQIVEAKAIGADVILLIASCLTPLELKNFGKLAIDLGLEVLYEVHTQEDLDKIGDLDHKIIGINNRNLNTFEVDLEHSIKLASQIPDSSIKVSESGISEPSIISGLKEYGFQGFLIGENFMKEENPGKACLEFINKIQ